MMIETAVSPKYLQKLRPIPTLESGDRLTRREFERRYRAMPHAHKAELIEGIVHTPSPVHFSAHSQPHAYIEGAPELAVEIAASSASVDMHDKKRVYRRNLVEGDYQEVMPDESGIIRSQVFPGLWLNVPALLDEDLAAVLDTLRQGLTSAASADFTEPGPT
jgi:hypothetical protein